ncbi:hypothetical protein CR513_36752, partial [Mucuna pruriens]
MHLSCVSNQSKAYKLYNPTTKKIIVSHDVVFDEERYWSWISNDVVEQQIPTNFDGVDEEERQQPVETDQQSPPKNVADASGSPAMASNDERPQRELTDLPKGHKTIGVKWVHKTKLKENGDVDKYKARLVAKGYKQEFGVDYKEVFALVAQHDTVRLIIALVAQNSWLIFQLDVKLAFLHGDLEEQLVRDPEGRKVDNTLYKQIVGSLIYMECPREIHILAAKRIFQYLQGTVGYRLFYKKGEKTDLIVFNDSDYAGDQDDRKSTSGYVFMIGSGAVSWLSKKQPIITLSITKAEFVATTSCAYQAIWVRKILEELCFKQQGPTPIYCDSSSAIKLSKNPILHGHSKHIDVKYHFLRNLSNDGIINLIFYRSEDQW